MFGCCCHPEQANFCVPGKGVSPKHHLFKALCLNNVESSFKDKTPEKSNPKLNPREELEFHRAQSFQVLLQMHCGDISRNFFHTKTLEGAVQVGGGATVPGGVQGTTGHGTQCSGAIDKEGISHRLDSMVLEALSNLNV